MFGIPDAMGNELSQLLRVDGAGPFILVLRGVDLIEVSYGSHWFLSLIVQGNWLFCHFLDGIDALSKARAIGPTSSSFEVL